MWRSKNRVAWALAGVTALVGCGSVGLDVGPEDDVERNRLLWASSGTTDYQYAVERLCFCGEAARPVRVTVVGGDPTARRYVESGDPVPEGLADLYPTVDGLFDILEDAYDRDAHAVTVTYDPATGVPLDFWIDYMENVADEELGMRVTETVTSGSP